MTHDEKRAMMLRDMYEELHYAEEMNNLWWAQRMAAKIEKFKREGRLG